MRSPRTGWLLLVVVVIAVNAVAIALCLRTSSSVTWVWRWSDATHEYRTIRYDDHRLVSYSRHRKSGLVTGPRVLNPASTMSRLTSSRPLIACAAVSALILGLVPLLRKWRAIGPKAIPRVTMLQVMALIGAISVWLWLARINWVLITGGTTVLVLLLLSAQRRGSVAREMNAGGAEATALSRAGFVGYSIAVLLALAWVTCIVVWDSYQHSR